MLGYLISPVLQVENTDGKPLVGGRIVVYRHGTTEPYITYKDFEGTHNPAEVILDSKGMAILIAEEGYSYDVYCRDRNYVEQWSRIGISIGLGGTSIISRDGTITVKSAGGVVDLGISDNDVTVLTGTGAERGTDGNFSISKTASSGEGLEISSNRIKVKKAGWYHIEATWYAQSNTTANGYRTVELSTRDSRTKLTLDLTVSSEQWRIIANDFYLHADEYIDFTLSGMGSDSAVRSWLQNVSIHRLTNIVGNPPDRVRPDWDEQDPNSPAYIFNKPNLAPVATTGSYESLTDKPDLDVYATKVENATEGNLAALDAEGNLVDSGEAAANVVHDANYVHTDNNYTTADKDKLAGIEAGAEVNVQADWTEGDSSKDSYVQNKPHVPTVSGDGTSISSIDGLPIYAASATRATQDGVGNNIVDTYGTKAEVSAKQDPLTPGVNISIENGVIDARNNSCVAGGAASFAIGFGTNSYGNYSLSNGYHTSANIYAHAEGYETHASGQNSHTEGYNTKTYANGAHAEGFSTSASGAYSHSEGVSTRAIGQYAHAEGNQTVANGEASHAEGNQTSAMGSWSHAAGRLSIAQANHSHADGDRASAFGIYSHALGKETYAGGQYSFAIGNYARASGDESFAIGTLTIAVDSDTNAEGVSTSAFGRGAHSEGHGTLASATYAHAEGESTSAFGTNSHAEGQETVTSAQGAHAYGYRTSATGTASHSEGYQTIASGNYSHAEGNGCVAGTQAHAEGISTYAIGAQSHAEGYECSAVGNISHVEGRGTISDTNQQHVEGRYNAPAVGALHVIGNGTGADNRSNIVETYPSGVNVNGNLTVATYDVNRQIGDIGTILANYEYDKVSRAMLIADNNVVVFNVFSGYPLYSLGDYSVYEGPTYNNSPVVQYLNLRGRNGGAVAIAKWKGDLQRALYYGNGNYNNISAWPSELPTGINNLQRFAGNNPYVIDVSAQFHNLSTKVNYDKDYMFQGCRNITADIVQIMDSFSAEDASRHVGMFRGCVNVPNYETLRTSETYSSFF